MSYASDAPDTIDGLRDALLACPSWVAMFPGSGAGQLALATAAIHYPDADLADLDQSIAPTPLAILSIEAGTFAIDVAAVLSMGGLEELGQALRNELMSRYRVAAGGLVIATEPSVARAGNATDWATSAGDPAAAIIITGPYGLNL